MDKLLKYIKENKLKVLIPTMFVTVSLLFAITLHTIDQGVNASEAVEITLDTNDTDNYLEQIMVFVSYSDTDKLYVHSVHEKRGKKYLTLHDGYSRNVFVFKNDKLVQFGTDVNGELTSIDDF